MSAVPEYPPGRSRHLVLVWDLPVRLFHWLLVVLVAVSWTTAQVGGNAMLYHRFSGYGVLVLVLFRVLWGFWGGPQARFRSFVRGPRAAFRYGWDLLRNRAGHYLGHNPLGGWMVIALLAALLVQAVTGLFANDDIFIEGPLYVWVDKGTSDALTRLHRLGADLLLVLIGLHVSAAAFYLLVRKDNLILPLVTGRKNWPAPLPDGSAGRGAGLGRALLLLGGVVLGVYLLLR